MTEPMQNISIFSKIAQDLFDSDITTFKLLDYGLFLLMLLISTIIGIYFGFISKRKQDNTAEYILGNKEMSIVPVAASLIASHVSGITMLALPADIYANGSQYIMCFISMIIVGFALVYVYIPVFYGLNLTSCFKYLEERFDRRVKMTASLFYTLACMLHIPIVIYVPALAFNQVSGINLYAICIVICVLCIFYTTVGGLRAVVWTDTIQFISIIGAIAAIMYLGTVSKGGIGNVIDATNRGGRLVLFNMDPNPLLRTSFWTVSFGLSTMWIAQIAANQSTIQRCLSLPNMSKLKSCTVVFVIGVISIKVASCYVGLLIYAEYEDCDPVSIGVVKKLDQILPFYTMRIGQNIPGLPGLFIAGVFSAALSSMSSTLNTLSGTIFDDLIRPYLRNPSEKTCSNIMKIIVLSIGTAELLLVLVVERLGAVMHLSYSLHGLTSGALLGIFTIGMLSRKVNTKGVIAGSLVSLIVVGIILIGAQLSTKPPPLHFNTDDCYINNESPTNFTSIWLEKIADYKEVHWLFRLSFMYYALVGATVMAVVAYPVSVLTGGCDSIDDKLLAPFLRKKEEKDTLPKYDSINIALKNIQANS